MAALLRGVEDQQIAVFVDLQGAVGVRTPQGVRCVDGGGGQSLRHRHPHVNTSQVHDHGLGESDRNDRVRIGGQVVKNLKVYLYPGVTYHGTAVGVGVKVTTQGNNNPSFQHVTRSRLRKPEGTHTVNDCVDIQPQFFVIGAVVMLIYESTYRRM